LKHKESFFNSSDALWNAKAFQEQIYLIGRVLRDKRYARLSLIRQHLIENGLDDMLQNQFQRTLIKKVLDWGEDNCGNHFFTA
jgi:hypothetical protein